MMTPNSILYSTFFSRLRIRAAILLMSFFATLCGLASPYFQQLFINQLSGTNYGRLSEYLSPHSPSFFILSAFFATLSAQFLTLSANYWAAQESIHMQEEIGERLYEKTLSLKRDSQNSRTLGEIVSIYATDVPGATVLLEQTLPSGASIFFPLILAPLSIYWFYDIPLWTTITTMLAVLVLNTILSMRQSRFFYRFKQLAAERTGLVNEWIQNIRTLRILGWVERFENKIFKKRIEETNNRIAMVTNGQSMNAVAACVTFFINLSGAASLIYLQKRPVDPGELLALLWIFGIFLVRPFRQMPWFFVFIMDAVSSIRRIEAFLNHREPGEDEEMKALRAKITPLGAPRGLEIQNLNLSIKGLVLLEDINFHVKPREFVAVVGEVGSGKSLLLLALMREVGASFLTYHFSGNVFGDDSEISASPSERIDALQMDLSELRSHFAYVSQEGFVMSATLRENIAFEYSSEDMTTTKINQDLEIEKDLAAAQFDLRTESLGSGLDTEIGERGVNLSGGQRQRIALARASFAKRPILLLDDCLSAVDVDTEKQIIEKLFFSEWKFQTRILVTHRLSVLKHADRICFIKEGRLTEEGTFAELMQRSQSFREFTLSVANTDQKAEPQGDPDGQIQKVSR